MKFLFYSKTIILALLGIILGAKVVIAADFYVDPVHGSMSNDGSQAHPWSTMQDVWDGCKIQTQAYVPPYNAVSPTTTSKCPNGPVHAGDTIYLLSGYHGELSIIDAVNTDWITVKAALGATPKFRGISLRSASKWIFDGLSISTSHYDPFSKRTTALFNVENHSWTGPSSFITIKNSSIFSVVSIEGWRDQDWLDKASTGISSGGIHTTIEGNNIKNVAGGISIGLAHNSSIKNNIIENSCLDGVRLVGSDHVTFEYNTVKNIYVVLPYEQYHYDIIQAWTLDGDMEGLLVRGNVLIACETLGTPYCGGCQGIGFFDGWFNNFIIENNMVVIDSTHGISVWGANNSRIVNNSVVSNSGGGGAPILLVPHKNHEPGTGNTVRNNFALGVSTSSSGYTSGTTVDHNIAGFVYSEHFNNPANLDFSLKSTSNAINAGESALSPILDLTKASRVDRPDIGAYEHKVAIPSPANFIRQP
jgi:hypothetical protein